MTLTEIQILKSRSGVYEDTPENRRKHRVGQKYGAEKQPEDGEKTEKKETDPAKELEAVNKVIAAINEGKLKLPQEEIMVLVEKKNNLELAKRQAEKIHSGVKANEEKRNAAEVKETSKKINEATKEAKDEGKQYASMDIKEAKKELVGKKITFKEYFFDGIDSYKDAEGEIKKVRLYGKEKQPIAEIDFPNGDGITISLEQLDKRQAAQFKIEFNDSKPEDSKPEAKEEESSEEAKESYTRVKFDDVPNSGKVNLKKYLSEKVRKGVDEKWSNIKNFPTDNLKKMEKGLVNDLNKNFEAIKKSQRAELLYSIMKVKGELEKRGKESQKKE